MIKPQYDNLKTLLKVFYFIINTALRLNLFSIFDYISGLLLLCIKIT